MALSCSNNCLITEVEPKACDATQCTWESTPILNGEQLGAVKDSKVALNDPRCVARAHPTAAISYSDPGLLNLRGLFWTLHKLDCPSERDIPVIGRSELIKTRTRVKTHGLKFVILEMTPCLYTGVQHERV